MDDKQKAVVLDTLEEITRRIGGCFGSEDKIFAGHPSDEGRAKELRKLATENNISLQQVMQIVDAFLLNCGWFLEHLKKEQAKARIFFAKKIT